MKIKSAILSVTTALTVITTTSKADTLKCHLSEQGGHSISPHITKSVGTEFVIVGKTTSCKIYSTNEGYVSLEISSTDQSELFVRSSGTIPMRKGFDLQDERSQSLCGCVRINY